MDFQVNRIVEGLANPVYVTHAPGDPDRLFVLEQNTGSIRIVDLSTGTIDPTPFLTVTGLVSGGEQGLLGLAFHPEYAENGQLFVYYTNAGGDLALVRYTADPDNPNLAVAASAQPVLTIAHPGQTNHNGGWIGFGPDGYLYVAVGDGGGSNDPNGNGQNTDALLGKILRLDVDGDAFPADPLKTYAIPADNPFAGATPGADEVWHYGLRNPFRASFDRETGALYIGDVGQGAWEEVDYAAPGAKALNYGWDIREGAHGGTLPGAVDPIHEYGHVGAPNGGNVITGGYVYRGPIESFQGVYFFADFGSRQIWSFRYDGTTKTEHTNRTASLVPDAGTIGPVSSFGEDAVGNLYIVDHAGEVFRLGVGPGTGGQPALFSGAANTVNLNAVTDGAYLPGSQYDAGNGNDVVTLPDSASAASTGFVIGTMFTARGGNDSVSGGDGGDPIFGGAGNDTVLGAGGNDTLSGGAGIDSVAGGEGGDSLDGGNGGDTLDGGNGGDTLDGGMDVDLIFGGAGDDLARGGNATDAIDGGSGSDTLDGGSGDDFLIGGPGGDSLVGGVGTQDRAIYRDSSSVAVDLAAGTGSAGEAAGDTLVGIENLEGSDFADTLAGDALANVLNGRQGDDLIVGAAGTDALYGFEGADTLEGGTEDDTVEGGADADVLDGGVGANLVSYVLSPAGVGVDLAAGTFAGGDAAGDQLFNFTRVQGSSHADTITGLAGQGTGLLGGAGHDSLAGGTASDGLYGEDGNDTLAAGDGIDLLDGGSGDDSLLGGDGRDDIFGGSGNDTILAGDGVPIDLVHAGAGRDSVDGEGGADVIFGGADQDTIRGGDGNDWIEGDDGADSLFGDQGIDRILGGNGNDTIEGGAGQDYLVGGTGADRFVFASGSGVDAIADFNAATEVIQLASGINGAAGLTSFAALQSQGRILAAGADAILDLSAGQDLSQAIQIVGVSAAQLSASNVVFV